MTTGSNIPCHGYAAENPRSPLAPFSFTRRQPRARDIVVEIQYCGVCHSDIHQVRDEWGGSVYPMVPGHEIIGRVTQAGAEVKKFKAGDPAGVGVMVDSCRHCPNCRAGEEQYCDEQPTWTYNAPDRISGGTTYGGYSNQIVVDEAYAYTLSPRLDPAAAAPLLCAGITTYSPLRHWKVGPGSKVGIIGLGGLGHMALKFAHAFGAHVIQFTTTPGKAADARRLGADEIVLSKDPDAMQAHANSFDFILDTVSAAHDLVPYLELIKRDGAMVLVGLPEQPPVVPVGSLSSKRRVLSGSSIGSLKETQEMLDYCAEKGIVSDIEIIPMQKINEAYERVLKNDVKYRFVIDLKTLGQ